MRLRIITHPQQPGRKRERSGNLAQQTNARMASAILYKFRSGTTFEALPLPGSAARLFDVKKAIVLAKKLDQGSMEFDLSVRDATTNVEYTDDAMLLPRGARLVVQRLPVAR